MAHAEAEAVPRINPDFSLNILAKNMHHTRQKKSAS